MQSVDHNIGAWEKRHFVAENCQKLQKIVIITSTPDMTYSQICLTYGNPRNTFMYICTVHKTSHIKLGTKNESEKLRKIPRNGKYQSTNLCLLICLPRWGSVWPEMFQKTTKTCQKSPNIEQQLHFFLFKDWRHEKRHQHLIWDRCYDF
jgi:hypothetical protein